LDVWRPSVLHFDLNETSGFVDALAADVNSQIPRNGIPKSTKSLCECGLGL